MVEGSTPVGDLVWTTGVDRSPSYVTGGWHLPEWLRDALMGARDILAWARDETGHNARFLDRVRRGLDLRDQSVATPFRDAVIAVNAAPRFHDGAFAGYTGALARVAEPVAAPGRGAPGAGVEPFLMMKAIEASPLCICITDARAPGNALGFVNPAFEATTGYSASEAVGANCRFLQGPGTDPRAVERIRRALATETPIDIEILNYRKSGEPFWNALSISPVHDETGKLTAFLGIQQDVTKEREAREFERHRQQMEALGRLSGRVAHEVNNLMQPVLMYSDIIRESVPETEPEVLEHLDQIKAASHAVRAIVRDILVFSRTGNETAAAHDIRPGLTRAIGLAKGAIPRAVSIELDIDLDEAAATYTTRLSETDLAKVVLNMCVNATHAMDGNGRITIALCHDHRGILLDIGDTGHGIPKEALASIFEPFFTTKEIGKGTGLGLSMVHSIISASGGTIKVAATGPDGTIFRVFLPRVIPCEDSGS